MTSSWARRHLRSSRVIKSAIIPDDELDQIFDDKATIELETWHTLWMVTEASPPESTDDSAAMILFRDRDTAIRYAGCVIGLPYLDGDQHAAFPEGPWR